MAIQAKGSMLERLGPPREEARVGPADAKAYELAAGEYVQIEDLQGCQVSDFLAFHRDKPSLGISTTVTRALVDGLFPLPGQGIHDAEGNRLLELVEDTVGRHDTFGIACNREYYEALGYPDHLNCTDNQRLAGKLQERLVRSHPRTSSSGQDKSRHRFHFSIIQPRRFNARPCWPAIGGTVQHATRK